MHPRRVSWQITSVCVRARAQQGARREDFRVRGRPERRPPGPVPTLRKPAFPIPPPPPPPPQRRQGRGRGRARARAQRRPPGRRGRPRPRPATTFPGRPRAARAPQLTHFPARPGLGRPPRPGGCSLLTGVWAGSGGGRRRRCWAPGQLPGFCGRHGRAGGSRRLLQ